MKHWKNGWQKVADVYGEARVLPTALCHIGDARTEDEVAFVPKDVTCPECLKVLKKCGMQPKGAKS